MRIVVVTSCTGEKSVSAPKQLTMEDFRKGASHLQKREAELSALAAPAEALYSGQQHIRLMRGVSEFRSWGANAAATLDLWILSAGYGLVPSNQILAPYEATFSGMSKAEVALWSAQLKIREHTARVLREPATAAMLLLGDSYLDALDLNSIDELGATTLVLCSRKSAQKLRRRPNLRPVPLDTSDTKRFGAGLVALKGELGARLLSAMASNPALVGDLADPAFDVLAVLESATKQTTTKRRHTPKANPNVDRVVSLPATWVEQRARRKLKYFIPEWDDLVDPDYDFQLDVHSGGSSDWSNEVFAHQIYSVPQYDGILISKVVAEKNRRKKARVNGLGVHRYVRVPRAFPMMGDCGAFGYILDRIPPYSTAEMLEYYSRLDFDFGVSIDHLIVKATMPQKEERFRITIDNAEAFIREHEKLGLGWVPVGAAQGWDPSSYAKAAQSLAKMGYRYIALGGLVRTPTPEVIRTIQAARDAVPDSVEFHVFGLARLAAVRDFVRLGVRSVDSASYLRRAWMGTTGNYIALDGQRYGAIRIPRVGSSFRAKRIIASGKVTLAKLTRLETECLAAVRNLDRGTGNIKSALDLVHEYDCLIDADRPDNRAVLRRTLEVAPWKSCPCSICRDYGVEVAIFRGNNRNRRRGFHNTFVFDSLLERALAGDASVRLLDAAEESEADPQLNLTYSS